MLFGFGLHCLGIFFNSNEFTSSRIFFLVVYILRELTEYKMGEFLYTKTLSHYTFHLYLGLKKERKGRKGKEGKREERWREGGRKEGRNKAFPSLSIQMTGGTLWCGESSTMITDYKCTPLGFFCWDGDLFCITSKASDMANIVALSPNSLGSSSA